ncbi:unnamed protein product [Natator depressus]
MRHSLGACTPDCYRSVNHRFGVGTPPVGAVASQVCKAIEPLQLLSAVPLGLGDPQKPIDGLKAMGFSQPLVGNECPSPWAAGGGYTEVSGVAAAGCPWLALAQRQIPRTIWQHRRVAMQGNAATETAPGPRLGYESAWQEPLGTLGKTQGSSILAADASLVLSSEAAGKSDRHPRPATRRQVEPGLWADPVGPLGVLAWLCAATSWSPCAGRK